MTTSTRPFHAAPTSAKIVTPADHFSRLLRALAIVGSIGIAMTAIVGPRHAHADTQQGPTCLQLEDNCLLGVRRARIEAAATNSDIDMETISDRVCYEAHDKARRTGVWPAKMPLPAIPCIRWSAKH